MKLSIEKPVSFRVIAPSRAFLRVRACARVGLLAFATVFAVTACGETKEPEVKEKLKFKKRKKLSEMKSAQAEKSPEELKKLRDELGIKSKKAIAKENAAMFEKGAREYVKARLPKYRKLIDEMKATLSDIEKKGKKWADSGRGKKKFDRFMKKYDERAKRLRDSYDELTGKGSEGGNTQAILGVAFRNWDELSRNLGPEVPKSSAFGESATKIRSKLAEVEKALGDIEKDESLVVAKRD